MADILRGGDTISGEQGTAYANINGQIEDMLYVKDLEAVVEKIKKEIRTLKSRATQHKSNGWSGTGTMTIYYVTTLYRKLMLDYAKTGKDTYFTLTITNSDATSTIGKQTVVLYNVNIDKVVLAKLDVESEALDEEVTFTFDGFDILDEFGKPLSI